jgi:hypothetical protein
MTYALYTVSRDLGKSNIVIFTIPHMTIFKFDFICFVVLFANGFFPVFPKSPP